MRNKNESLADLAPVPWPGMFPALIVCAALLAYANSFAGSFLFDDGPAIVENQEIRTFPPRGGSPWQPRWLVTLSLSLNYRLDGLRVRGYHAVNLAIHILAALALYELLRRTMMRLSARPLRPWSARELALAVALLWAVHPLQTESVTYIIQRAEALMGLCYLLTLYGVLRGAEAGERAARLGWYAFAIISCVLGMMSKPVMATAPLVALLYDRLFLASSWREIARLRWPLYLGLAASCLLLTTSLQDAASATGSAGFAVRDLSSWEYLRSQPGVLLQYLRLAILPYPLCFDYGWPVAQDAAEIVLPGLEIVALLALTGWALWRWPRLGFLGACFFLILAPTSSIMPIWDLAVEHRLYLPLAALLTLLVLGVTAVLGQLAVRSGWSEPPLRKRATALLGITVFLLTLLTFLRNEDYQSPLSMWGAVLDLRPQNARAHFNRATELRKLDRTDEAERAYLVALQLKPEYTQWRVDWAGLLLAQGRADEAKMQLRKAFHTASAPNAADCELFGLFLAGRGKAAVAVTYFAQALHLEPGRASSRAFLKRAQEGSAFRGAPSVTGVLSARPSFRGRRALAELQLRRDDAGHQENNLPLARGAFERAGREQVDLRPQRPQTRPQLIAFGDFTRLVRFHRPVLRSARQRLDVDSADAVSLLGEPAVPIGPAGDAEQHADLRARHGERRDPPLGRDAQNRVLERIGRPQIPIRTDGDDLRAMPLAGAHELDKRPPRPSGSARAAEAQRGEQRWERIESAHGDPIRKEGDGARRLPLASLRRGPPSATRPRAFSPRM
jgi:protein O-mannosyl-transferase